MRTKLFRSIATIALSAILAVSGVATTAYAAETVETACNHDDGSNYYIVDYSWTEYVSGPDYLDYHWVFVFEERYCMDCGAYYYFEVSRDTEDHNYNGYVAGAKCTDCGHVKQ